jgi:putative DNA methylase
VPEEFPTDVDQENERLRLFALISELVQWENTTEETVLEPAREEIRRSWRRCCADNADHPEAAELFNPKTFQIGLDRLTGEEEEASLLAAFELQINPSNPGLP